MVSLQQDLPYYLFMTLSYSVTIKHIYASKALAVPPLLLPHLVVPRGVPVTNPDGDLVREEGLDTVGRRHDVAAVHNGPATDIPTPQRIENV